MQLARTDYQGAYKEMGSSIAGAAESLATGIDNFFTKKTSIKKVSDFVSKTNPELDGLADANPEVFKSLKDPTTGKYKWDADFDPANAKNIDMKQYLNVAAQVGLVGTKLQQTVDDRKYGDTHVSEFTPAHYELSKLGEGVAADYNKTVDKGIEATHSAKVATVAGQLAQKNSRMIREELVGNLFTHPDLIGNKTSPEERAKIGGYVSETMVNQQKDALGKQKFALAQILDNYKAKYYDAQTNKIRKDVDKSQAEKDIKDIQMIAGMKTDPLIGSTVLSDMLISPDPKDRIVGKRAEEMLSNLLDIKASHVKDEKDALKGRKGKDKQSQSNEGGLPKPKTQAEFDAIPTGQKFIDTDGAVVTKG